MLLTKLAYGTVTSITATGELGGLFLPRAVGYRVDTYTSAGFSTATFATYDEASNISNPYINKVMVTPPALGIPCRAATTSNISLSGLQTIDGVALIAGDRVIVKNQSTATQNGIYTVASGSWTRATDNDTGTELQNRLFFQITSGTVNADYYAVIQNTGTITLGTTGIIYDMIADPVFLESQTVYWLRFKNFPTGAQWYATDSGFGIVYAKLATTANITLSGNQTIDGLLTVNNDIVIVKNQTTTSENGLYYASSGVWSKYPYLIGYESLPWLLYVTAGGVNSGRTFASSRTVAYTPFAVYTNVFTLVSMKLYPTLADATAETNALIPAYRTAFDLEWITKPYTPIACVEMAAASVTDIYCCPEPVPRMQEFFDHVEIVLEAGSLGSGTAGATVLLTMFTDNDGSGNVGGSSNQISTYNGATYTGAFGKRFWYANFSYPVCSGTPKKTVTNYFEWNWDSIQYSVSRYQISSPYVDLCVAYPTSFWQGWKYAPADYQALPQGYEMTGSSISNRVTTHVPRILSVELKSAQTIPPTIRCYLVNAVFQRTTADLPSGQDIALGTIDVTLTYDAASSTYYGPVANYYNIPGRLSMPANLLSTVAGGTKFLDIQSRGYSTPLGYYLGSDLYWKVNSSNQLYFEQYLSSATSGLGAPLDAITLSYSSYSDLRKPITPTLNFYKTNVFKVYTNTNGSLLRSDPTTQTATPLPPPPS